MHSLRAERLRAALTAFVFLAFAVPAAAFDTSARAAIVLDVATDTVLFAKNADEALPPASMSKLMTLNMVFEALSQGRLELSDQLRVSQNAMNMGGSTMFLNTQDMVSVDDLIRGVIVQSGNDASVVLAEALGGSESAFANSMTRRARELGMHNSTFANATGWPHPDHLMSVRDLSTLARRLIVEFPEYYGYFAQESFEFDGRAPANAANRNPLLSLGIGADGLKTGHTEAAGYGLVGSAVQDGRRLVFVLTGLDSAQDRLVESERMVNWAFREFTERTFFESGEVVEHAKVWMGEADTVPVAISGDATMILPYAALNSLTASLSYDGPLEAPVEAGDVVGVITISADGIEDASFEAIAADDVAPAGFLDRYRHSTRHLIQSALAYVTGG